ncbi:conserved hypothetical protein [Vibrio harveyi]|nr:conserved hypothetical protein [Vibrio harveyi]
MLNKDDCFRLVIIIFVYKSGDYSTKNDQQSNKNWYDVPLVKTGSHHQELV